MNKFSFLILILFLLTNTLYSKNVSKVSTTAASFLNIDVGARAVGMGGAFVAVVNDPTAMYWNVGSLANLTQTEALFSYNKWIADINVYYDAIVLPVSNLGVIGINGTFVAMDDMKRTTIDYPNGTGEMFSASNMALGLAFARKLTDRFSIGANIKYVSEKILHCSAQGLAFDIGTLFDTQYHGLKIGMNISNYGTKMRITGRDLLTQVDTDPRYNGNNPNINAELKTDAYELPLMFRIGLAFDLLQGKANSNLLLCLDASHPNDDYESINAGAEYTLNNMYSLRCGFKALFLEARENGLSFGAGFKSGMGGNRCLKIDYGYMDFGLLKETQMITLSVAF